jgi:hypothetical protein
MFLKKEKKKTKGIKWKMRKNYYQICPSFITHGVSQNKKWVTA